MFHLEPNNRKCLKEEITKGVLVSGEYEISKQHGQMVDLVVVDNNGHHFYNKENAEAGKFAFTTDNYNVYEICTISRVPPTSADSATRSPSPLSTAQRQSPT